MNVRRGNPFSEGEILHWNNRYDTMVKSFEDFMERVSDVSVKLGDIPMIGILLSGGGYRSMICSLAMMVALDHLGLLDMVSHISSLSGSAWFLSNWYAHDKSLDELKKHFKKCMEKHFFNNTSDILHTAQTFMERKKYGQPITIVDMWGSTLGNVLFDGIKDSQNLKISSLREKALSGKYPYPIFTAITPTKGTDHDRYKWLEFNPFEMGGSGLYVDIEYSNSVWNKGDLQEICSEPALESMLGIFGSAFSVDYNDIIRLYGTNMYRRGILKYFKAIVEKFELQDFRIAKGKLLNSFYGLDDNDKPILDVFDAGISFNSPILPLLERGMDIIIHCDAGDTNPEDRFHNFQLMLDYVKTKGFDLSHIDPSLMDFKKCYIFTHQTAPSIIYIPNIVEYSTFKFQYSPEEFDHLFDSMYNTIINLQPEIEKTIYEYL